MSVPTLIGQQQKSMIEEYRSNYSVILVSGAKAPVDVYKGIQGNNEKAIGYLLALRDESFDIVRQNHNQNFSALPLFVQQADEHEKIRPVFKSLRTTKLEDMVKNSRSNSENKHLLVAVIGTKKLGIYRQIRDYLEKHYNALWHVFGIDVYTTEDNVRKNDNVIFSRDVENLRDVVFTETSNGKILNFGIPDSLFDLTFVSPFIGNANYRPSQEKLDELKKEANRITNKLPNGQSPIGSFSYSYMYVVINNP